MITGLEADRPATVDDFREAGAILGKELAKVANRNVIEWKMTKERNFQIVVGVCGIRVEELRKMEATDQQIIEYLRSADAAYRHDAPNTAIGDRGLVPNSAI